MKPRIFVSVPDDRHLDENRRRVKRAIISAIADRGFDVVGFEQEQYGAGLPVQPEEWSVERAQERLQRCDGLLVLALARTHVRVPASTGGKRLVSKPVPTPYNHLEGALAISLGIPILVVAEGGMDRVGILGSGVKPVEIPATDAESWVQSTHFLEHLPTWSERVKARRDVFLGYCSKGSAVAGKIRSFLEKSGFTVLDWSRDFRPAGATILEEIERAASRCRCAVFILTKDDHLAGSATRKASFDALPRDNVLVEAGYFTRARGKSRVAIIREAGTKMPADFGGVIYLGFSDREKLAEVKAGLRRFMADALSLMGETLH